MCTDDAHDKIAKNSKELRESYTIAGYKRIEGSPNAVKVALEDGPVIATIRAGNSIFRHFSKGVIDSEDCLSRYKNGNADHAVLIVGYGKAVHKGGSYLLIKNSFSPMWGSKGYARIATDNMADHHGVCGIYTNMY